MPKHNPMISVIMSTYNEEKYIETSMKSLLNQTFEDFEIIIVDDASTDNTRKIIEGLNDERIYLICNEQNQGLTKNLNKALKCVRGKYIARMDGDDIALPERFEKQFKYMEKHQDTMLVSCYTKSFGDSDLIFALPDHSEILKVRMLVRPVYAHPGFMMRRELIEAGYQYNEEYRTAQDYEFASRVAEKNKIGLVPEVLLLYRVHKKQISAKAGNQQFSNADKIRKRQLEHLGVELSEAEWEDYQMLVREVSADSLDDFRRVNDIINKMIESNQCTKVYDVQIMEKTLKQMLYTWVIRNKNMKYIMAFPKVCGYQWKDMLLFLGEVVRTIKEKIWFKIVCSKRIYQSN